MEEKKSLQNTTSKRKIGFGAYSDVYHALALKEIHDYHNAFSEIETPQTLENFPEIVALYGFLWREDEDVLVLDYFKTDLASLIAEARKNKNGGISSGEIKRWVPGWFRFYMVLMLVIGILLFIVIASRLIY